jgi:hypothetical protein
MGIKLAASSSQVTPWLLLGLLFHPEDGGNMSLRSDLRTIIGLHSFTSQTIRLSTASSVRTSKSKVSDIRIRRRIFGLKREEIKEPEESSFKILSKMGFSWQRIAA